MSGIGEQIRDLGMGHQRVAYLGPSGSFSEILTEQVFGEDFELKPHSDIDAIHDTVMMNGGVVGVLPVRNSITSSVHQTIDNIYNGDYRILGEAELDIHMQLFGLEGAELGRIERVASHIQALGQTTLYLKGLQVKKIKTDSTSAAAQMVIEKRDPTLAALGAARLAELYPGLKILDEDVGDQTPNTTRFLVVVHQGHEISLPLPEDGDEPVKTTVLMQLHDVPGALPKALMRLYEEAGTNLTKIENRPIPDQPGEQRFWVDMLHPTGGLGKVAEVLGAISVEHRMLGTYRIGQTYQS